MAAAGERVLTRRELNRALLARQLLLERSSAPIPRVLERMGGLQAQYAPSMYIGLWSRMHGLERDDLTRALERRRVVQATIMRATIHLVSARDFWPLTMAVRDERREWWRRVTRGGPSPEEMRDAADRLRSALAAGPLRRTEIEELLGKERARAVGMWLDLVRVPPSGTWERRRADLYGLAESWVQPAEVTSEEATELLVRRYLGGFGPAARGDIAWAGLSMGAIAPTLEAMRLRRFRSEDGEELLDLPRAPLPDPETPAPVRLLPTWDATLLAHARRTGVVPEEHKSKIFNTKMPQSVGTFLVDGVVAGTWRFEDAKVRLEPFEELHLAARNELAEEAERLRAFHQ